MKAVRDVKAAAAGLAVTINADGTHCLPIIMNRLREKGIDIISVNLKKPTLDDVFVHYTGRAELTKKRCMDQQQLVSSYVVS